MVSVMLSAAMKRQYSSVIPLLRPCLPVFDGICEMAITLNTVNGSCVGLYKTANTRFDR